MSSCDILRFAAQKFVSFRFKNRKWMKEMYLFSDDTADSGIPKSD